MISRRDFALRCSALAVASSPLVVAAQVGSSSGYPSRPIRIVVPSSAGAGPDTLARFLADELNKKTGQPFFVESIPGAAAMIGTAKVAHAPPDGYTILFGLQQVTAMNQHLYAKMPYSVDDLAPVTLVAKTSYILLASNGLPANNLRELIALAKKSPGKLTYASTGVGGSLHLGVELLKSEAGIDLFHVPYKSPGTAILDLAAGRVDLILLPISAGAPVLRGGQGKALAISSSTRYPLFPQVECINETIPNFTMSGWNSIWVPAKTPKNVVDFLNNAIREAFKSQVLRERYAELGMVIELSSPDELQKLNQAESSLWADLIRKNNIKPE